MSISGDYPHPVTVNGFSCKNCTDVDYAKKHVDPAHPKSGPYGVNASSDPSVKFGGNLSHLNQTGASRRVNGADASDSDPANKSSSDFSQLAAVQRTTAPGQTVNIQV